MSRYHENKHGYVLVQALSFRVALFFMLFCCCVGMSLGARFDEALADAFAGPPLEVAAAPSDLAGCSGFDAMFDDAVTDMLLMPQIVHISNSMYSNT